mgnify:CR=1 FL=1
MKHIQILLALMMVAAFPATAPAQNYSLRELLQEGLQNSYSLKIVRNDEQTAANNNTLANAGALPTVSLSAGYSGALDNTKTKERGTGQTTHDRNVLDHTFTAGITADWTLFDGFRIQTNIQRLRELQSQSRIATRVAIEDYIANLTAEYFNLIQQEIRYKNLLSAVQLSKERLRIVEERYIIGSAARLDYRQAGVDFNADSSDVLNQHFTHPAQRTDVVQSDRPPHFRARHRYPHRYRIELRLPAGGHAAQQQRTAQRRP